MPHPKRKTSTARRDKRRTHQKIAVPLLTTCPTTGRMHKPHEAFWKEGKLYYRGEVVMEKPKKSKGK